MPQAPSDISVFLDPFPMVRYRLQATVQRAIDLPEYAGSTLRGIFGHALKRSVCITRLPECRPCALYRSCAYPAVFETPPPDDARRTYSQIPNPFVVEPPPLGERRYEPGEPLSFDLVLIGPARQRLALIALAWQNALQRDVTKSHGAATLNHIQLEDGSNVLELPSGHITKHAQEIQTPPPPDPFHRVTLDFTTLLRLQRDGRILTPPALTPRDLLMALVRRTANLVEMQIGSTLNVDFAALNRAAADVNGDCAMVWRDWNRYSNRQHREMRLGGLQGRWTLVGELKSFWPFLYLGQWLHVGKNCSFGLGRYTLAVG